MFVFPISSECAQELIENVDFPGSDITFLYSPDARHCQQLCTEHPSCLFFTFVRQDWTRDNRNFYCYLKSTPSLKPKVRTPLQGLTSGFSLKNCPSELEQPCRSQLYKNVDFLGADYKQLFTSSDEECHRVCTQDPHCRFFTFVNDAFRPSSIRYNWVPDLEAEFVSGQDNLSDDGELRVELRHHGARKLTAPAPTAGLRWGSRGPINSRANASLGAGLALARELTGAVEPGRLSPEPGFGPPDCKGTKTSFVPHSAWRGVLNEDKPSVRWRNRTAGVLSGVYEARTGSKRFGVSIKSVHSVRATGIYASLTSLFFPRYKCHLKHSWSVPRTPVIKRQVGAVSGFSHKLQITQHFGPVCQGKLLLNTDIPGHDIDKLPAASAEHCQALCSDKPRCTYFSYNSDNFQCYLKGNRAVMVTRAKVGFTSGIPVHFCQMDDSWLQVSHQGVSFEGSDFRSELMDDPDTCQRTCTTDPLCQFYTYFNKSYSNPDLRRRCYLKRVITAPAPPKVDKYKNLISGFSLKNSETLEWPRQFWPLLLQCVFTGKAQDAYASLESGMSLNYDHVKEAVLRAYELMPEEYRQRDSYDKPQSSLGRSFSAPRPPVTQKSPELDDVFLPFVMKGAVSLTAGGPKVPVVILRDSAASQSVILSGVLPLSEKSSTDSAALVRGFGMQFVGIPLHTIHLDSELVTGPVIVGVSDEFPVGGVSFILGNDLAGGKVLLNPENFILLVPQNVECHIGMLPVCFTVCQGKLLLNTDIPGHDIDKLPAASAEHCQALCSDKPRCTYFSYNSDNFQCYLKGNRDAMVTRAKVGFTSGIPVHFCQMDDSWLQVSHQGVSFEGSDFRSELMDDPDTCQRTCTTDPLCQFYTYFNKSYSNPDFRRRCYLKRVITAPAPPKVKKYKNLVSGFSLKNCV
ncbi:uncharacterized protein LOC133026426 [Limanda limanda]|uniref:uncharacterized protein LOC133026426 n=1 Tax=Limanda limanda TaxID=27771 RepID=UPI0029C8F0AC|nr:uncharacterized protein LOC133026426 [Limanda limanda]